MFRFLPVLLFEIQIHLITASVIVEVLQPCYHAELGDEVVMECRFRASEPLNLTRLSVLWQARLSREGAAKEVYKLTKGQEDLTQQHRDFRGRATVLQTELKMGLSMLRLTNVKLRDAGTYICLVDYKGDDYKYINLEVEARYKKINIQETREDEDVILTCQSEGYPQADVSWYSENDANFSAFATTTYEMTDDGRYNITSALRVKPSIYENYTCIFWNKELNEKTSAHRAVFLSDESSTGQISPISFILPICLLALLFLIALIFKVLRRKPFTNSTQKGKRRREWYQFPKRDSDLRAKDCAVTVTH